MKNFVIPAVLAGVMASGFSTAAQLPASIKDKGEIVVAIMPNYPPMDFKDPATNTLTGFDYDLGNALAERLGVKIKWQETGFEQMINALTTDRVDMVLSGMTDTAERQASVTFVDYFTSGPQFYTLQKNKDTNEIVDLCGKKVGTSRRTTFPSEIAEWSKANCEAAGKPAINVVGTEGSADARAQLRQSRIDAAMQGSETLSYLKTQEKDMYKTVGLPISEQFTGMGVSKKKPELSEAVKVALQSMIDDGSYQAILKKWDLELGAIKTATINAGK
ncbi:amino acid ABC transporter substrate-binding protein, PAAT family [Pseudomonas reinekei]|uniref:ABC transporter substrate-binding protein n=1 Tax=Pseudomonas reinekei TaxID=395598 RepID=A0A1H0UUG9_PSERE|nr:ABC transporter substrate-binding protein [Pseudomonas reinekei]KAB0488465.1 ABC transporter substrate-binding protein [Pseudomonas reinekei]OLU05956.1 ABC transporter substrate-binding protein [Pseudomonas reinekei]SDP69426.1 amino acid ABC transporter substrate-binding protein, PAAT family [Pseudomonas reinekei]